MTTSGDSAALAAHVLDLHKIHRAGRVEVTALFQVTASFQAGRITAVLGSSAAGKTSLFNLLAGLDKPSAGQVGVAGQDLQDLSEAELARFRRTRIGLVFEGGDLVPTLSVKENLLLQMSLAKRHPDEAFLDSVVAAAGLQDQLGAAPAELSPLQQQLVAVARSMLDRPVIVLADEPTGRLHSADEDRLLELFGWARTNLAQATVLFTHDPLVAARADRVLVLADGQVVADLEQPTAVSVLTKLAELDSRRRGR